MEETGDAAAKIHDNPMDDAICAKGACPPAAERFGVGKNLTLGAGIDVVDAAIKSPSAWFIHNVRAAIGVGRDDFVALSPPKRRNAA